MCAYVCVCVLYDVGKCLRYIFQVKLLKKIEKIYIFHTFYIISKYIFIILYIKYIIYIYIYKVLNIYVYMCECVCIYIYIFFFLQSFSIF